MKTLNDSKCFNLPIYIPTDEVEGTKYGLETKIEIKEKISVTEVTELKTLIYLSTRSIHLKKEIYKPGCIEIEFIMKDDDLDTNYIVPDNYVQVLKDYFFPSHTEDVEKTDPTTQEKTTETVTYKDCCRITLIIKDNDKETEIATDYVVRDVKVRRVNRDVLVPSLKEPSQTTKQTQSVRAVFVKAYSPDYFLTLEKSCCIYRGEKLSEIIRSKMGDSVYYKRKGDNGDVSIFPPYTDLRLCNTTRTQSNNYPLEMLQPYLVQYNESFHDFIVRVANRCGELFYYESGQLLLGIDKDNLTGVAKELETGATKYKDRDEKEFDVLKFEQNADIKTSQSFTNVIEGEISISDDDDIVNISNVTKSLLTSDKMTSSTSSRRDENVCMDELLVDLKKDDSIDFDSINEPHWFEVGHEALKADGIANLLTRAGTKAAEIPALSSMLVDRGLKSVVKDKSKPITITDEEVKSYNQYTTPSLENAKQNFSNEFYEWIEGIERSVTAGIQESHRETLSADDALLLGQFVSIDNLTSSTYYINAVDLNLCTSIVVEGENNEAKTTYNVDLNIRYCPLQYNDERSTEFEYQKKVFPPLADIPHIRKAEPQQAAIVSTADPLRNGRVQIRYPWQPEADGDKSPWLSVATPFTGEKDSGMLFAPDKDDYVMVNYEGGNIERPYVDGSLFHSNKGATNWGDVPIFGPKLDFRSGHSAITKNGSGITFVDGIARNFIGSLFPSLIQGILSLNDMAKDDKRLGGSLILSDYYGMYSISMSSLSRSISIDSPWGKVDINAFTGITLSAPNGDIKISGKNVTIEAGNKVSITSGTNIKGKAYATDWAKAGGQLLGGVAGQVVKSASLTGLGFDVTKALDVSFIRSVYEIIMRPVDGSLTLTSGRNLIMQAGKGKVSPPASTLSTVSTPSKMVSVSPIQMLKQSFKSLYSKDSGTQQINAAANTKTMVGALVMADYAIIDFAFSRMGEAIKTFRSKKAALGNLIQNFNNGNGNINEQWNSWSNFINKVYDQNSVFPDKSNFQANGHTIPQKTYDSIKSTFEELKQLAKHTDIPEYCKKKFKDDKFYSDMHKSTKHGIGAADSIDSLKALFDVGGNKATIFGNIENTAQNIITLVDDLGDWEGKIADAKKLYKRAVFYNIVTASSHVKIGDNDQAKTEKLRSITLAKVIDTTKDASQQEGWGDLKTSIREVTANKDNSFAAENPTGSTFGSALLDSIGLGDIASYGDGEWSFFGSMGKLFNINGQAGPRTYWDGTQSNGTILVSAGDKTFQLGKKPAVEQVTRVDNDDLVSDNDKLSLL